MFKSTIVYNYFIAYDYVVQFRTDFRTKFEQNFE